MGGIITHCYIMFIPHRAISAQMAQQDDVFCTLVTFACQCNRIFCESICHLRNGGDLVSGWMQYRGIAVPSWLTCIMSTPGHLLISPLQRRPELQIAPGMLHHLTSPRQGN